MNLLGHLLVPYTRAELYRFDELMLWAGVGWQAGHVPAWKSDTVIRGKQHGYLMKLDCSDWCQRLTYFMGRYYEFAVLRTLDGILRPGDHFVDIGGNIGMLTLHARFLVGTNGRIDTFEPNPICQASVREHLLMNGIDNVTLHPYALADKPGSMTLNLTSQHTGTATLAEVEDGAQRIPVEVRVGDDEISGAPRLVKIDVEGYEFHVLKGLEKVLAGRPFVLLEMLEQHFQRAGTSTNEVAGFMRGRGYKPYGLSSARRRRFLPERLIISPVLENFDRFSDILWATGELPPALNAAMSVRS